VVGLGLRAAGERAAVYGHPKEEGRKGTGKGECTGGAGGGSVHYNHYNTVTTRVSDQAPLRSLSCPSAEVI
jgi:hypothetical protein